MKKTGISREGMEPEWTAREVDKSNKLIRARMLEDTGEVDAALSLYVDVAAMEEQIRDYCRSIGLIEKSWINAISAASCWELAGDLYRALQGYELLLSDPALTPKMRNHICGLADKLRERRRQWSAFQRQLQNAEEHSGVEPVRSALAVSVK
jgi:hypothetical protein